MVEPRIPPRAALLAGGTLGAALLLFLLTAWPLAQGNALQRILLLHAMAPRLGMAVLCGAALGLSGAVFQQVLRNPLAEPGTLGVFAGARLALAAATLWAPALLGLGTEMVALAGAILAVLLVLALAARSGFAPLAVILGGLVVTLCLDAGNKALMLLHLEALSDLFVSQSGGLSQNNWQPALSLLPRLGLLALLAALLCRPLAVLDLEATGARAIGLPLPLVRALGLGVAVLLGAFVAAAVGGIGFIGLASAALARLCGARRLGQRMLWGALVGAGMLTLVDQLLLHLAGPQIPAGSVTALLGAPLLLWLLRRMRPGQPAPPATEASAHRPPMSARRLFLLLLAAMPAILLLAFLLGRAPDGGWHCASATEAFSLLPWRAPRILAALAAGSMLGVAGMIIQRLTGNAMASPELLGVSAGAALGLILGVLLGLSGRVALTLPATIGGGLVLLVMLALGRRSGFAPGHMLLAGVALSTAAGSLTAVLLAGGDPRAALLLNWLAGSTYALDGRDAAIVCGTAAALLAVVPLAARWLGILPLGPAVSTGLGLNLPGARLGLLALASALTAAATLLVGPLSFVGLVAPHLARRLGARGALAQYGATALLGGGIMVLADWLGRMVAFPWQVPAGLMATLLGSAYVLWLMSRR